MVCDAGTTTTAIFFACTAYPIWFMLIHTPGVSDCDKASIPCKSTPLQKAAAIIVFLKKLPIVMLAEFSSMPGRNLQENHRSCRKRDLNLRRSHCTVGQ